MKLLSHLLTLIHAIAADRARIAVENVLLRQQIAVLKRGVKRPQIEDSDRTFWVLATKLLASWMDHLIIVTPETVIRWHLDGFGKFWKQKSRAEAGRPRIAPEIIDLIDAGLLKDYADAARRLGVSRARVTQIVDLIVMTIPEQEGLLRRGGGVA